MYKFTPSEVKRSLHCQITAIRYDLSSPAVIACVSQISSEEDCVFEAEIALATLQVIKQETLFMHFPSDAEEYLSENYEYYASGMFLVPDLLPYVDEPDFDKFMEDLTICTEADYNNRIELVHMPHGNLPEEDEGIFEEVPKEPCTFLVGVSDRGAMGPELIIEYLLEVEDFSHKIANYIDSKKSRGEENAEHEPQRGEAQTQTSAA